MDALNVAYDSRSAKYHPIHLRSRHAGALPDRLTITYATLGRDEILAPVPLCDMRTQPTMSLSIKQSSTGAALRKCAIGFTCLSVLMVPVLWSISFVRQVQVSCGQYLIALEAGGVSLRYCIDGGDLSPFEVGVSKHGSFMINELARSPSWLPINSTLYPPFGPSVHGTWIPFWIILLVLLTLAYSLILFLRRPTASRYFDSWQ